MWRTYVASGCSPSPAPSATRRTAPTRRRRGRDSPQERRDVTPPQSLEQCKALTTAVSEPTEGATQCARGSDRAPAFGGAVPCRGDVSAHGTCGRHVMHALKRPSSRPTDVRLLGALGAVADASGCPSEPFATSQLLTGQTCPLLTHPPTSHPAEEWPGPASPLTHLHGRGGTHPLAPSSEGVRHRAIERSGTFVARAAVRDRARCRRRAGGCTLSVAA